MVAGLAGHMARLSRFDGGSRATGSGWYPGEMARTRRLIRENLPLVGLVIEVADARAPRATRHPDLRRLTPGRPILTVLSKADLADPGATRRWLDALSRDSGPERAAVAFAAGSRAPAREVLRLAPELARTRGPRSPVRAMVVGLPNVGKSTLINRLVGRAAAGTGDRPGVTRGKQWLRAGEGLELLDLPGILVPGSVPRRAGLLLALLGVLPDHAYDSLEVARWALDLLERADRLPPEVGPADGEEGSGDPNLGVRDDLLARYALARGHLKAGGLPDLERAARSLIGALRLGRLGRLTYEFPGDDPGKAGSGS